MQKYMRLFVITLVMTVFMSSCSLFEASEATLSIEDTGKADDRYQYFINITYDDGEPQEMVKLGSEMKEKIMLGADEYRGAEITVNKIDSEKQTIVATGRAEAEQILGDIRVKMRPVGKTSIDLKMTAGDDSAVTFGLMKDGSTKGEAVFDAVYATSGDLDEHEEYIEIYRGEPQSELRSVLKTIPIKAGRETDADVTYYLMFQGKEIDRIVIKSSDYIKNETVKHSVISETLLSYDIKPFAEQDRETWADVDITWDADPVLAEDIDRVVFSYMGKEWKIPYEKGEFSIPVDDRHPDMTISYWLTYHKDRSVISPVRTVKVERDNRLRAVEIHYGQIKPDGKPITYSIKRIPEDAPLSGNEEIKSWQTEYLTVTPSVDANGKTDIHHGTLQGWMPGTAEIEYRSGDFVYNTNISVISIPELSYDADGRDITFYFEPYGDPNVEITLWRKAGSVFNSWMKVPTDSDITGETLKYREGSRRFPVWFRAEYRQKNGEGTVIESNWVTVEEENILPPAPPVDGSITIVTPLPGNVKLTLREVTDPDSGTITYTLDDDPKIDMDGIFWQLGKTGEEMKGPSFIFDPAEHTDLYTYENTLMEDDRTLFLESLTLFAKDKEGRLFSAETELRIDVTGHIGGETV